MAVIPFLGGMETPILLITLGYFVYKWATSNFDFWDKRGVPYVKPVPFVGNFLKVFLLRTTIGHLIGRFYTQFNGRYFGMFVLNTPHLVIKDPELIKAILVKDFNFFYDRTVISDEECDSLTSKFLFFLKSREWKHTRVKMTPAFTTGKLKSMLALINKAADEMTVYIGKNVDKKSIESKEVCAKFSTDVIASCAFGLQAGSFENENAPFRAMSRKMFEFSLTNSFRQTCYFIAPAIVKLLKLPFLDPSITNFMREVFWKTIDEREKTNVKRNDLIDILTQMRKEASPDDPVKFEGDGVVAQAGQFYAAGFETVSSTLAFTLHELCLQPNVQSKLRSEIKSQILKHGGLTYEALQNLKYMQMCLMETLRKYPVLPFLDRLCTEDYKVPDSDFVIEKGTPVFIPLFGLHYDPQYFPDPEKYDPERFSDNCNSNVSCTYLPFGEGPRVCIGERFALMVAKIGLANILLKYEVERSADTPVPIQFETKSFLLASTIGLPIKYKKLISEAA